MASNWYVKQGEMTYGPLDDRQLKHLATQGKINKDANVSRGKDGPWVSAQKIKGLFSDSLKPTSETSAAEPARPPHTGKVMAGSVAVPPSPSPSSEHGRRTEANLANLKPNTGSGWVLLTLFMFAPTFSACYYALGGKAMLKEHYVVTTRDHVREGNRIKLDELEERSRYFSVDKSETLRSSERLLWRVAAVVLVPIWMLSTYKAYRAVRLHITALKQSGN